MIANESSNDSQVISNPNDSDSDQVVPDCEAGLIGPSFGFQWHLTDRCNLRCAHCYQDRFTAERDRPLGELRRMADEVLGALGDRTVSINLTGGEPLVFPPLFGLIDHLHTFPNLQEVHIITNGTVADDETCARIAGYEKIGVLKVSLESSDPATNDAIRGRGNSARVRVNLARLRMTGKRIVLMATLARYSVGHIEGILGMARELDLAGVIFERFVPLGRGRALSGQVLTAADWRDAVGSIMRCCGLDAEADDLPGYRAFWVDLGPDGGLRGAECNLGAESMALMPDGTVVPCRRLPIPCGKLLETPFDEVLARLDGFAVRALRPLLRGTYCGACGIEACGGCRALALAMSGDPFGDDPQCPLT